MKPAKRIPCSCRRGFATWRIEDRAGVRWCCDLCRAAYWTAFFNRIEAAA